MRWIVFLFLSSVVVPGWTQETEISRLRAQLLDLEKRVQQLELLLNQGASTNSSLLNDNVSSPSLNHANWRRLKIGMSPDEVRQILGEPDSVSNNLFNLNWSYKNSGFVSFFNDRLESWSEP